MDLGNANREKIVKYKIIIVVEVYLQAELIFFRCLNWMNSKWYRIYLYA